MRYRVEIYRSLIETWEVDIDPPPDEWDSSDLDEHIQAEGEYMGYELDEILESDVRLASLIPVDETTRKDDGLDTCLTCGHVYRRHLGGEDCALCVCTWFDTIGPADG